MSKWKAWCEKYLSKSMYLNSQLYLVHQTYLCNQTPIYSTECVISNIFVWRRSAKQFCFTYFTVPVTLSRFQSFLQECVWLQRPAICPSSLTLSRPSNQLTTYCHCLDARDKILSVLWDEALNFAFTICWLLNSLTFWWKLICFELDFLMDHCRLYQF